jgi:hypothetical protein
MVDRGARDRAAQLLRDFVSGKISNDEFEDNQPPSTDHAIAAIWKTAWVFYNDTYAHRLVDRHRLPADMRRICARWIIFLHSDCEYVWPDIPLPGIDPATRIEEGFWRRLVATGSAPLRPETAREFLAAGHYPVWPFSSAKDYREALRKPRLLPVASQH